MLELRFKEAALAALEELIESYEHKQFGLGERLHSELFYALDLARAFPEMYREYKPAVRCFMLRSFPYCVYYRISGTRLTVQAILDARSDPRRRDKLLET